MGCAASTSADARATSRPSSTGPRLEDLYEVNYDRRIGTGHYGTVYYGRARDTGCGVAVKVLQRARSRPERLENEVDILRRVSHPAVVALRDVFETPDTVVIVTELVEGGELFDRLVKRGPFSERAAAAVVRQIASAIAYLHSQGIIHR